MTVKIKNAASSTSWYANKVGQTFQVNEKNGQYYLDESEYNKTQEKRLIDYFILKTDCEIV